MNYEDDIEIDETALDVEWLDQPKLAIKYGKLFAYAKMKLAKAEEKIKVIRSELIREANDDPTLMGSDVKPTGPNIEAYYRNHDRHKKIKAKIIKLQFKCNMTEIAHNEVSFTRKASLVNLVSLHYQQYFAGPQIPRNLTEEIQDKRHRIADTSGMQRTKK